MPCKKGTKRNGPCKTSKDICPRCTRSMTRAEKKSSPGLLKYYRSLCKSSKCSIHGKSVSAKSKEVKKTCKAGNRGKKARRGKNQRKIKIPKIDIPKSPCTVLEFEEMDSIDGIDLKMFAKVEATVEDFDELASLSFANTAGYRLIKEILNKTVIWPLKKPEIFKGLRTAPRGILLFGPPGTGKTFIGRLIASETNSTFLNVLPSILTSKGMGECEHLVRTLFLVARARQPSVIFLDDIDSILPKRSSQQEGSTRRMKNEFYACMESINIRNEDRIIIVGATNRPYELDEGARQRFFKRLYIALPNESDRKEILLKFLESECHSLDEVDIQDIVRKTKGYSVADLKNLSQEAAMVPVKALAENAIIRLTADKIRPISIDDFLCALQLIKPTVSEREIKRLEEWDSLYGYGGEAGSAADMEERFREDIVKSNPYVI